MIVSSSSRVVGTTRYHNYDGELSEVEIGWTFLVRSCWGGAFNKELKFLTMKHAFRYVDSVVYLIDENNIRSQRSVEKIGAAQDGTRSKTDGTEMLLYKISKHAFSARFRNS